MSAGALQEFGSNNADAHMNTASLSMPVIACAVSWVSGDAGAYPSYFRVLRPQ